MDYDMLLDHVQKFNKDNNTCITDQQCMAVFLLLDLDDSGELE